MSIFVYVEDWNGAYKKSSFEAVSYAKIWANSLNTTVTALTSSAASNPSVLGDYGADNVLRFEIEKQDSVWHNSFELSLKMLQAW